MRSRSSGRSQRRDPNRSRVSRNGWGPGTPSAWETPAPASAQGRLVLSGGFTVIDREQRRLHDRIIALGFADLAGYLVARCHQQTSLALLASELGTTTVVGCRLLDHAGLTHHPAGSAPPASVADQHLTERASQLGFPNLQAYLTDRVTQQAWPLTQVASELGIDRNTVRDRRDRHGLRGGSAPPPQPPADPSSRRGRSSAARHAWPSLASPRWTTTCGIGMAVGAGRCGG